MIAGDPTDAFGFPRLVADYLTWMGVHGYSPTSINSRRVALGLASDWLVQRGVERPVEIHGPHPGVEQLSQGRGALAALAVQVVTPRPAPLVHLGNLVQLAEARCHAGLHGPLAQQDRKSVV